MVSPLTFLVLTSSILVQISSAALSLSLSVSWSLLTTPRGKSENNLVQIEQIVLTSSPQAPPATK